MPLSRRQLRQVALAALPHWQRHWSGEVPHVRLASASENTVYRVSVRTPQAYAMRVHRWGYHNLAELESELIWIEALNHAGIGVPNPIRTDAGSGYATVTLRDQQQRHVGLVEWIPGRSLAATLGASNDSTRVRDCYFKLGALAARLHNQSSQWVPPDSFARHAVDEHGLMGEQPFWGRFWEIEILSSEQRELFVQAREDLFARLSNLAKTRDTFGLIHADLHAFNLLVDGSELRAIDFDDAGFGWHVYELAVALAAAGNGDDPRYPLMRDALIQGYRSERPLGDELVAQIPMFLLIRALASLGWMNARPELKDVAVFRHRIERTSTRVKLWLSQQG